MKRKILITIFGSLALMSGSIVLGATVEMELPQYYAMVALMTGGYLTALR